MPMTVRTTPALSESELSGVEASMGVSIPAGYRKFLRVTDGGKPVEYMVIAPRLGVTKFLGAREIAEDRARLRGRLPKTLLPIVDAAGGNRVCISVAHGDQGEIYYWNHQLEHLGAEKATERIAASFDDFVSQLRVMSREERAPARVISVQIDPEFRKLVREQEARDEKRPTIRWPREGD
jgi:cell wall assembly regulator SMI1